MNGDIVAHQRPGQTYLAGRELWDRVPDFAYDAPTALWVLRQQGPSLAILAVWLVAAVALLVRASTTARVA
jgi:hypothetical protein